LYASGGRLELALQVATDSLNHLEQLKLEKERFVDDLLEVLAEIHWRLGNVDQSIALLERCLTVNPNRAPARKQLIKIYNQKGEVAASEKHQAILRESAKNEASDAKNPEAVVDSQN
jgi:DNA-binding SARP family transcriptional activator